MKEAFYQMLALFRKEILVIWKDSRSRIVLVVPVILQTLLFGYVATFDLKNVPYAVLDEDHTAASRQLVAHFDGSRTFERKLTLDNSSQIKGVLDNKKAVLVLHIGNGTERNLQRDANVAVQVIVDGRNGNVAGQASSYASSIIESYNLERSRGKGGSGQVTSRAWFNPNQETRWSMLTGMLIVLAMVQVLMLTSLSISREKEQGTYDQLLVTPLGPFAILVGKSIPSVLIGLMQSTLVFVVVFWWFEIPFAGSFSLLYLGLFLCNLAIIGVGLVISTMTATMQQSMLYAFSCVMTLMLLSGFVTPVASMPQGLQIATLINPARHGVEIVQRVFLEGAGFAQLKEAYGALLLISLVSLGISSRLFRSHLGE